MVTSVFIYFSQDFWLPHKLLWYVKNDMLKMIIGHDYLAFFLKHKAKYLSGWHITNLKLEILHHFYHNTCIFEMNKYNPRKKSY